MSTSRRDRLIYCCIVFIVLGCIGLRYGLVAAKRRADETSADRFSQLLAAARNGDNDRIRKLLAEKTALESTADSFGYPPAQPLISATQNAHIETVRLLLDAGANPKINSNAPLLEAISDNQVEIVRMLLERGSGLKAPSFYENRANDSAIMLAAAPRWNKTPSANEADQSNITKQLSRRAQIIRCLIAKGDDVNARNQFGQTALHYSALQGYTEIVTLLLENHAEVDAESNSGDSPLLAAIRAGHTSTVKALLSHGASLNANPDAIYDELMVAPLHEHAEVALLLTKKGVTERLRHLLSKGVNPNFRASDALIEAINRGQMQTVTRLLDSGANLDASALIAALSKGHLDCAMLLLQRGPQIQVSWHGVNLNSSLMLAAGALEHLPANSSAQAVTVSSASMVQELLRRNADDGFVNAIGENALIKAAEVGNADSVKLLLQHDPTLINAPDQSGRTPLCHAIRSGSSKTVQILISNGAKALNKKSLLEAIDFSAKKFHQPFNELRSSPVLKP